MPQASRAAAPPMATDFGFFERSLHEPRVYRVWRGYEREIVRQLAGLDGLDILRDTDEDTLIRTTNLMDPGTPDGVRSVEERFGVALPPEFHRFYQRWNGGVLVYGALYFLLPAEEIIETAVEFRELQEVSLDLPWHVLRFCELDGGNFVALRRKRDGEWEAIFTSCENVDTEYLEPEDSCVDARRILAPSFSEWLRKVHDTDGWPWGEHIAYPEDRPPCERVW